MQDAWTVEKLLEWTKQYLKKYNVRNPRISAERFLSEILNTKVMGVYLNYDKPLTEEELTKYKKYIKRRREHEPVQYILNKSYFMGLEFYIEKGCFIPRDTTEKLINIITDEIEEKFENKKVKVLEIGGGSGAVAISLVEFSENIEIDVLEKENIPQKIIKKNIEKFGMNNQINLIEKDYFDCSNLDYQKYDIVVSNPPYIGTEEKNDLDPEVLDYEPHESLFGGENGLNFYKKFVDEISKFKNDSLIYLEFGYNQKKDMEKLFSEFELKFYKDLDNIDRFVRIKK